MKPAPGGGETTARSDGPVLLSRGEGGSAMPAAAAAAAAAGDGRRGCGGGAGSSSACSSSSPPLPVPVSCPSWLSCGPCVPRVTVPPPFSPPRGSRASPAARPAPSRGVRDKPCPWPPPADRGVDGSAPSSLSSCCRVSAAARARGELPPARAATAARAGAMAWFVMTPSGVWAAAACALACP